MKLWTISAICTKILNNYFRKKNKNKNKDHNQLIGPWSIGKEKTLKFGSIPLKKSVFRWNYHNIIILQILNPTKMDKWVWAERISHSREENLHEWNNWSPCKIMCIMTNEKNKKKITQVFNHTSSSTPSQKQWEKPRSNQIFSHHLSKINSIISHPLLSLSAMERVKSKNMINN